MFGLLTLVGVDIVMVICCLLTVLCCVALPCQVDWVAMEFPKKSQRDSGLTGSSFFEQRIVFGLPLTF